MALSYRMFRVDLNGQNFVLPSANGSPLPPYVPIPWNRLVQDHNSGFNIVAGTWQPPAGLVSFLGLAWVRNIVPGGQAVLKVWKNKPADLAAGIGALGGYPNTQQVSLGAFDLANGSDIYSCEIWSNVTWSLLANAPILDGNDAHVYWSGAWWGEV